MWLASWVCESKPEWQQVRPSRHHLHRERVYEGPAMGRGSTWLVLGKERGSCRGGVDGEVGKDEIGKQQRELGFPLSGVWCPASPRRLERVNYSDASRV